MCYNILETVVTYTFTQLGFALKNMYFAMKVKDPNRNIKLNYQTKKN